VEGQVVLVAFAASGEALVLAHEAAVEALRQDGVAVELAVVPEVGRHACDWHMDAGEQSTVAGVVSEAVRRLPAVWVPVASTEGE
jgi:acetyl esterase/lipase